ncbi:hypothetical protein SAMN05216216_11071 [Lacicoccus qingdaonensis]|uniref:Uncharacterized protein n=2 Tax=Lacicoccus qingdaonensis TaxID=576118 RepID=A0A1G9F0P6_9BACL|nr:hypothetical protein SAMN05216216_11071 [Salinicoccus qingdaonensis]
MISKQVSPKNYYEMRIEDEFYYGTVDELVEKTGLDQRHIRRYVHQPTANRETIKIGRMYPVYQVANTHDGTVVAKGTKNALAKKLGMQNPDSLHNSSRYDISSTSEYVYVADTVGEQLEDSKHNKASEPPKESRVILTSNMDFYWRMVFRDMFRGWGGDNERPGV